MDERASTLNERQSRSHKVVCLFEVVLLNGKNNDDKNSLYSYMVIKELLSIEEGD